MKDGKQGTTYVGWKAKMESKTRTPAEDTPPKKARKKRVGSRVDGLWTARSGWSAKSGRRSVSLDPMVSHVEDN